MTQTAPTEIIQRRHTDPPWLWFSVFLGSVLIHLFGLGILSWLMTQQAGEVGTAPIPVELIAVRLDSKIRKSIPSRVVANAKISGQKSGTRSQKLRSRVQGIGNRKQGKFQASPKTSPSPLKNTSKVSPRMKPKPPTPPPFSNNKQSPLPPKPFPPPSNKPSPQGGGLVATVSGVRLPNDRDLPDNLASPLKNPIVIAHYPSSPALKNLKQPLVVHVYVVIDKAGNVILANPLSSSSETNGLVKFLLKDWKFKPATQGGQKVEHDFVVDLKIAPRLIKSK